MEENDVVDDAKAKAITAGLNRHGYGFQHAVIAEIRRLNVEVFQDRPWHVLAVEFPVDVGRGSRVDIVVRVPFLKWRDSKQSELVFLTIECKRVNPACGNWCFFKAPFISRMRANRRNWFFARMLFDGTPASVSLCDSAEPSFDIGVPIKGNRKGDAWSAGGDEIESAITQAIVGATGVMLERVSAQADRPLVILPAIVTTAVLLACDVDLAEATLSTGEIDVSPASVKEVPYLFLQYHMSPGLLVDFPDPPDDVPQELEDILDVMYTRTVPVINANGIEKFLTDYRFNRDPPEPIKYFWAR